MAEACAHLCQPELEETAVIEPLSADVMKLPVLISGTDLLKHHIDAGHILSPQGPEKVSGSQPHHGVAAVVLDHMADVFHPAVEMCIRDRGIQALIVTCAELGLSRPEITEKVRGRFSLSKEASEKYVDTWIPTKK